MKNNNLSYYNTERNYKNPIFFSRFSNLNVKGLKVLDFGCGHGSISIALAEMGAKTIVGADLNQELIDFAEDNLHTNFPQFKDKISFHCKDFRTLEDNDFDLIISKATFEHVIDLDVLLVDLKDKLKIGGKLISGFGPLYNAPYGDHRRLSKYSFPWAHVLFSEEFFLKKINKNGNKAVKSVRDLGLNGYSLKKYKEVLTKTPGFAAIDFRTNVSEKASMKIFKLFSFLPLLKEYFTYNIYCTLERTS